MALGAAAPRQQLLQSKHVLVLLLAVLLLVGPRVCQARKPDNPRDDNALQGFLTQLQSLAEQGISAPWKTNTDSTISFSTSNSRKPDLPKLQLKPPGSVAGPKPDADGKPGDGPQFGPEMAVSWLNQLAAQLSGQRPNKHAQKQPSSKGGHSPRKANRHGRGHGHPYAGITGDWLDPEREFKMSAVVQAEDASGDGDAFSGTSFSRGGSTGIDSDETPPEEYAGAESESYSEKSDGDADTHSSSRSRRTGKTGRRGSGDHHHDKLGKGRDTDSDRHNDKHRGRNQVPVSDGGDDEYEDEYKDYSEQDEDRNRDHKRDHSKGKDRDKSKGHNKNKDSDTYHRKPQKDRSGLRNPVHLLNDIFKRPAAFVSQVTASSYDTPQKPDPFCSPVLVQRKCSPHSDDEPGHPAARAYWDHWKDKCCRFYQPPAPAPTEEDEDDTELPLSALRNDLTASGPLSEKPPQYHLGTCIEEINVPVPRFSVVQGGPMGVQTITRMKIGEVAVPKQVPSSVIKAVKKYAVSYMHTFDPVASVIEPDPVSKLYHKLRSYNSTSGFVHPAGTVGPMELALLWNRMRSSDKALQAKALEVLLTGEGVPPKRYPPKGWYPPNDTPDKFGTASTNYSGPYSTDVIRAGWGGSDPGATKCPENYPADAPINGCGHISLVELDGQMAYKQALAFWATGDRIYADNAFRIIDSWALRNKEIGLQYQNGPLESGWAVAAMAKALELLRYAPGWQPHYDTFVKWTNNVTLPSMDVYVYNISAPAIIKGVPHVYGNWHSTVADAWMAVALLTNDRPRFNKAVQLYNETVDSYLKWGKGEWAAGGRAIGECTETLRDIYHSEFGLGGLLQVAEMAWQQDLDLYSASNYSLLAAMELHARIINAGRNEDLLPPGFKFVESMPKAKEGTIWKFDIRSQSWWAHNATDPAQRLFELKDGVKYLVGITWLPTGWELGYNHYAGRLGIQMPETAKLLMTYPVEHYTFHWGLGTLTHANSALRLWREGLQNYLVCTDPVQKINVLVQQDAPAYADTPSDAEADADVEDATKEEAEDDDPSVTDAAADADDSAQKDNDTADASVYPEVGEEAKGITVLSLEPQQEHEPEKLVTRDEEPSHQRQRQQREQQEQQEQQGLPVVAEQQQHEEEVYQAADQQEDQQTSSEDKLADIAEVAAGMPTTNPSPAWDTQIISPQSVPSKRPGPHHGRKGRAGGPRRSARAAAMLSSDPSNREEDEHQSARNHAGPRKHRKHHHGDESEDVYLKS